MNDREPSLTGKPPLSVDVLPVSGAWRPGDPPGRRQFHRIAVDRPFALEGGGLLHDVTIAYETWGELDAEASNAILVCHAITGDAHASGRAGQHEGQGWWDGVIGSGCAIDTDRFFVVCANILGGCQGTTGPSSNDPATGRPYGSTFPIVSIRDIVRTQAALADHLGVAQWFSVVGGSMGGMQAIEWAVMYPERVRSAVVIASGASATAQQIGYSAVQRMAIALDPNWRGGEYYDAAPSEGPHRGLAVAREIAQITYRTDTVFQERFGRGTDDPLDVFSLWQRFDVESYLDYHGAKLVRRFDANSYLVLSKAMDLHDIGRNRGGIDRALARLKAPVLVMSINSDALYYPRQQAELRDGILASDGTCRFVVIDSDDGHDAFLLAIDQVGNALDTFLDDVEKHNV
jgi:homoserine O-acetyltransferase